MKVKKNPHVKKLLRLSFNNSASKSESKLSKLNSQIESMILKEIHKEMMPSIINATKTINVQQNSSNQLAKSHSSSSLNQSISANCLNNSYLQSHTKINHSLLNLSKKLVHVQNYIRLNQNDRVCRMISNSPSRSNGRKKFLIENSLRQDSLNNSHRNHIVDEFEVGNQSSRDTIDQFYKQEITRRKQAKHLPSFSTQTPFMIGSMQSKQMQMVINSKRSSLPEEAYVHINRVRLKPMMSRMISHNLYNYLYGKKTMTFDKA